MHEFMEKFKTKAILYPTVIMVLICLVVTAALAGTNLLTEKKIEKINKDNEAKAMSRVMKADSYENLKSKDFDSYEAKKGGETVGYVFKITEKGYGGDVSVMVGIDKSGKVAAVEVLDVSNETPGLGQNTAKKDFTKQFVGKDSELTAVKYGTSGGSSEKIDAVASATITSKAVTKAVNKAIKAASEIKGGAN